MTAPEAPALPELITAAERGERPAAEALFSVLYEELHRMAQRELARHGGDATLGATTLLHEAYLDIAGRFGPSFPDRARFMGYAARVMRGLIIDASRRRHAVKRGGRFELTSIQTDIPDNRIDDGELTRISGALDELAGTEPELAQIVDLRFFCGFSFGEIAAMRCVSERTVQRMWDKARIYLYRSLRAEL